LTFINTNNQLVGNATSISPVFATDRGNQTSLLYQETDGLVPVGSRSMLLMVTLTCAAGARNNGEVDKIGLALN
jgi:hypothetical protein